MATPVSKKDRDGCGMDLAMPALLAVVAVGGALVWIGRSIFMAPDPWERHPMFRTR